jgi:hypothetical protein
VSSAEHVGVVTNDVTVRTLIQSRLIGKVVDRECAGRRLQLNYRNASPRFLVISIRNRLIPHISSCAGILMQSRSHANRSPSDWLRTVTLQGSNSLTYSALKQLKLRGLRNGGWARLEIAEKGLFRCALWIAKARNKITNTRLMVQILRIALKLRQNFQSRIVKAGRARAVMMFEEYARPGGVFSWAPRMHEWLHDQKYIFYLGVLEVNS